MRRCKCSEWDKNIGIINKSLTAIADIVFTANPKVQIQVVPFKYCPYCGKKLVECNDKGEIIENKDSE